MQVYVPSHLGAIVESKSYNMSMGIVFNVFRFNDMTESVKVKRFIWMGSFYASLEVVH